MQRKLPEPGNPNPPTKDLTYIPVFFYFSEAPSQVPRIGSEIPKGSIDLGSKRIGFWGFEFRIQGSDFYMIQKPLKQGLFPKYGYQGFRNFICWHFRSMKGFVVE